jgi:hypothetical protein
MKPMLSSFAGRSFKDPRRISIIGE